MRLDTSIKPRRWQIEAFDMWAQKLHGVVSVVTGGGKTVFSYLCLQRFFEEYPDGRAIIVVPTLALLDQWFIDICDATDLDESEVACFSGHFQSDTPALVNIVVLNTARTIAPQLSALGPSLLIVDECHRSGSVENSLALRGIHQAALGLSATPEREGDTGFDKRIAPVLGPIIYTYGYHDAKLDGVIVDFNLINIEITVDENSEGYKIEPNRDARTIGLDNVGPEEKAPSSRDPDSVVARSITAMVRAPWAAKLALSHKEERIIIFHERVSYLGKISSLLSHFDLNSVAYHSGLSESHRRDNLRLFRRGMVNILVTCRALDEGANIPEANVAIIAHSTRSTRQRIQRLGRVLRPAPGKAHALVYTLFAGKEERTRLSIEASALEGISEVIWKRGNVQ